MKEAYLKFAKIDDIILTENYTGRGFFLHPSLTISKIGDEQLGKVSSPHVRKISLDYKIGENFRILVTDDGFICPLIKLDEAEIHKFLNILIATLITKGVQSVQISWENDWALFKYEEGDDFVEIGKSRSEYSLRNKFEFERDDEQTFPSWLEFPRKQIISKAMEGYLLQAYNFYNNLDYADDLLLIGQAWSLSFDGMESASFLYAWMIIENMLDKTWEQYVKSLNRTKKEKDFLTNNSSWYVSHKIQGLSIAGKIDDLTRDSLNRLRVKRNEIVHERNLVSKNEALDCMTVVTELVYNKINYDDAYLLHGTKLKYIR